MKISLRILKHYVNDSIQQSHLPELMPHSHASRNERRRGRTSILESGGNLLLGLVVAREAVDPALDEDEANLECLSLRLPSRCFHIATTFLTRNQRSSGIDGANPIPKQKGIRKGWRAGARAESGGKKRNRSNQRMRPEAMAGQEGGDASLDLST
ncbi:hypothetical protein FIBSPDRAFT_937573 [Athelia psychrophila]|uniref:Uncharacterized protein n=1 Tax=Athelia psychrophila TaxID=1759441 RepID=A0A166A8A0_9AGAM|nr:hypothetical protein FIBSPDRAFT_937573 [Fibularhizoctonia sp. CBS 109695]